MLNRTMLAAFLATSALALGIDPGSAKRVAEDKIECPRPDPRADPREDPRVACTGGPIASTGE